MSKVSSKAKKTQQTAENRAETPDAAAVDYAVTTAKLSDLIPDDKNFNKGTEFGQHLIEKSLRENGAGRSILLDKNNRIIAGNKTAENAAAIDLDDVVIVETDGTKLVAVKRTDIDLDSEQGRKMALADNATSAANLDWDEDALKAMEQEMENFSAEEWGIKYKPEKIKKEMQGEIPFTEVLNEEHNYVVLYFDNTVDWLQAVSLFGIEQKKCYPTSKGGNVEEFGTRYGIGRVVKGAEALERIRKQYESFN